MTISDVRSCARAPGLLLAGVLLAALLAAGSSHAATLKIAALSPEGSAWMELLRAGAKKVEKQTDGRVSFKFYPGGVMGNDKAVLRKIRLGELQGAVLTEGGLVQTYPDIQIYGLPLEFRSYDEVDYVRQRLDPVLTKGLQKHGYVSFGFAEVGFAYAMSKRPVTSVADVRKQKVWTPEGDPGSARALESFGVTPIPLSISDVLSGLQTGLINGVAVPPVGAIALQWHTQLKYIMDMPLLYVYGLLTVADRPFQHLSEADRAVVRRVMGDVVTQVNARAREDQHKAKQALIDQGLELTHPTDQEVAEWREYAQRANQQMVSDGLVSNDLKARVDALLAQYRSGLD